MEYPTKFRSLHLVHWGAPWAARTGPPLPPAPPQAPTAGEGSGRAIVVAASRARRLIGSGGVRWGAVGVPERAEQATCGSVAGVAVPAVVSGRKRITVPHADEAGMEDDGLNYLGHMLAGSVAGMSEHAFMFPADTVKTRMQVSEMRQQPQYSSVFAALNTIVKTEGVAGLYRGVVAVVLGAIPGHALHFGVYEGAKARLGGSHTQAGKDSTGWQLMYADAMSGSLATLAHDGVSTPVDVIKQRMQLFGSRKLYGAGVTACARQVPRHHHLGTTLQTLPPSPLPPSLPPRHNPPLSLPPYLGMCALSHGNCSKHTRSIYKEGGFRAFYVSYPTTVAMNIPVFAVYFASYENFKKVTPV